MPKPEKSDSPVQQLKDALDLVAVKDAAALAAQAEVAKVVGERDQFAAQVTALIAERDATAAKLAEIAAGSEAQAKALAEALAKCDQLAATLALHPQVAAGDAGAPAIPTGSAQAATVDPAVQFAQAYQSESDPIKRHALWLANKSVK